MSERIVCPYCFKEFNHYDVHFRAETVFTEEELDPYGEAATLEDINFMEDGQAKTERKAEYLRRKEFLMTDDEKYNIFWHDFGSTTEKSRTSSSNNEGILDYRRPIILPNNRAQVRLPENNQPEFDSDGYLTEVTDIFGRPTNRRVCPHCHNPLPQNYGKFPIKFISVIGITGAGKTVFLSKLIENFSEYADKLKISPIKTENSRFFVQDNPVKVGNSLPGGTPPDRMTQPLYYTMSFLKNGKKETFSFVIYDIAGENCVDNSKIKKFGKFISNSDGIIILQDPDQFRGLNGGDKDNRMVETVLDKISGLFTSRDTCEIPLAMCISKSDTLKGILPDNIKDRIFQPLRSACDNKCFSATDYNEISRLLAEYYEANDRPTKTMLETNFENYNFFAITSLNCQMEATGESKDEEGNVRKVYSLKSTPNPMRIEEPLFWLFVEFGFVKSDKPVIIHSPIKKRAQLEEKLSKKYDELKSLGLFQGKKKAQLRAEIAEIEEKIKKFDN